MCVGERYLESDVEKQEMNVLQNRKQRNKSIEKMCLGQREKEIEREKDNERKKNLNSQRL